MSLFAFTALLIATLLLELDRAAGTQFFNPHRGGSMMGIVSFGLWVHHMYATGLPELSMHSFAAASLMVAIASAVQIFAWIATLWGPQIRVWQEHQDREGFMKLHLQVTGLYWYFSVVAGAIVYATLYLSPYVL